jgi:hypothetical protein
MARRWLSFAIADGSLSRLILTLSEPACLDRTSSLWYITIDAIGAFVVREEGCINEFSRYRNTILIVPFA